MLIKGVDTKPKTIIYVFIDGIGLGIKDTANNPFSRFKSYFFANLGGKSSFEPPGDLIPTDAVMGVEGTPQSATGQTALFTGFNGAEIMGRHVTGFPTYTLRPYIRKKSIVKKFVEKGLKATLLNSYSEAYLKRIRAPKGERVMSASSVMQIGSNQNFMSMEDYLNGKSLYMDITNWFLRKQGTDIPLIPAKETGRKLVRIARNYDLVVYEYFFTDKIGHEPHLGAAKRILNHIEQFMEGVWEEIDTTNELFVLSSDHGNFEDLSHSHHTKNPVPTIVYGKEADKFKKKIKFLYDIPKVMMELKGVVWK